GKGGAVSVTQSHVDRPGREGKIWLRLTHQKPVGIARLIAGPAEEVAHLEAVDTVFLDFDFPEDVGRTGVVRRTIVGIAVRGNFHWAGDIVEFGDVAEDFVFSLFGHLLDENKRIGGKPE